MAIYCDLGLNFVLHDQSSKVAMSVKYPKSLEYSDTFLSVPVITKYSPEWWKFSEIGLQPMRRSLNFSFFYPSLSK
jgi:hypothetical protein